MWEKLKSLDKKVWILAGVVAVAVVVAVILLVTLPGDTGGEAPGTGETQSTTTATTTVATTTTSTATTASATVAGETTTTGESVTDETTTEGEASASTTVAADGTTVFVNHATGTTAKPDEAVPTTTTTTTEEFVEQPTATNPEGNEIFGQGSEGQPYLEYPSEDMTVTTVEIPAGRSLHYAIYRVGGMILTIDSPNAYVVYDGKRYNATGGKVTVEIGAALASESVPFEIGNTGSAAASFMLQFTNPTGSYMNPVTVSTLGTVNDVSLPAGAESGHYYRYIAEKDGTVRFYLEASKDSILLATNNRNSAQRTTEADGFTDERGDYVKLDVQKGDEILINVGAKPNARGKYPAVDISWHGVYE